ncbi:MAG: hypothetical protein QOH09_1115, partial [Pseudonocardiales bacterium]|nr:hypothetical protein [Pseudonocardiales bacterium]
TAGRHSASTQQDLIQQGSSGQIQLANYLHDHFARLNARANIKTARLITATHIRPLTIDHWKPHLAGPPAGRGDKQLRPPRNSLAQAFNPVSTAGSTVDIAPPAGRSDTLFEYGTTPRASGRTLRLAAQPAPLPYRRQSPTAHSPSGGNVEHVHTPQAATSGFVGGQPQLGNFTQRHQGSIRLTINPDGLVPSALPKSSFRRHVPLPLRRSTPRTR